MKGRSQSPGTDGEVDVMRARSYFYAPKNPTLQAFSGDIDGLPGFNTPEDVKPVSGVGDVTVTVG